MQTSIERRTFCWIAASSIAFPGCIGSSSGPGDLEVANRSGSRVSVTVAVETHSNDPEEDSRSRSAPPPETEPLARRQFDYTLSDGETVTEDEFISEPGVYFVEATVNTGESRDVWADYEATAGGLDGTYVSITVNGDGIPVISFPYND